MFFKKSDGMCPFLFRSFNISYYHILLRQDWDTAYTVWLFSPLQLSLTVTF